MFESRNKCDVLTGGPTFRFRFKSVAIRKVTQSSHFFFFFLRFPQVDHQHWCEVHRDRTSSARISFSKHVEILLVKNWRCDALWPFAHRMVQFAFALNRCTQSSHFFFVFFCAFHRSIVDTDARCIAIELQALESPSGWWVFAAHVHFLLCAQVLIWATCYSL